MNPLTFKCPECDEYKSDKLDSLRIHCQKKHSLSTKKLYIALFLSDSKEPTCLCGCGEKTKFLTLQKGFSEYILGHSSRINNNWGHNKLAQNKSQSARREMFTRGEIKIWCKGKTKDDPEVFRMIEKGRSTIMSNIDELNRRSNYMSNQWKSGVITHLTGSSHSQWKGGTSALNPLCRSKLYRAWGFHKLRAASFKCTICNSIDNLEVHHDDERFSEIMQKGIKTLGEPGDDWNRKECFAEWIVWYHTTNNVSGLVLCELCHKKAHNKSVED